MECWEFMKCGRQAGGSRIEELGVCPAWPDHGQACSLVAGRLCRDMVREIYDRDLDTCQDCDFYRNTQVTQHSGILVQRLLELCPIGTIGVNRKGVITIFNPAAELMTGRSRESVLGRANIAEVYQTPEDARQVKRLMYAQQHGGPGRLDGVEVTVKGPDGRTVPIRLWGFVLFEAGREVGNVGFFYDLTDEKKAQEAAVAQEKLNSVLEMAGAMLHHLSQPLQVLASGSSLLLKEIPPDAPLRESVEYVAQSVNDLKQILERIRGVSHANTTAYVGKSRIVSL